MGYFKLTTANQNKHIATKAIFSSGNSINVKNNDRNQ